jgi:hypothetical protein
MIVEEVWYLLWQIGGVTKDWLLTWSLGYAPIVLLPLLKSGDVWLFISNESTAAYIGA